jgi:hypothetical protein
MWGRAPLLHASSVGKSTVDGTGTCRWLEVALILAVMLTALALVLAAGRGVGGDIGPAELPGEEKEAYYAYVGNIETGSA